MHRQPGYIEFGGYVFLHIGRCYNPLVLYTRCTRGRGLDCPCSYTLIPWTSSRGVVLGAVDTVLALGGCHWLTHIGTVTPLWLDADLGGSYSGIVMESHAFQLSNACAGLQP